MQRVRRLCSAPRFGVKDGKNRKSARAFNASEDASRVDMQNLDPLPQDANVLLDLHVGASSAGGICWARPHPVAPAALKTVLPASGFAAN